MGDAERTDPKRDWKAAITEHPIISGTIVGCIAIGTVMGVWFLTDDWSLARRIAAGAVGGAGVGVLITTPRIIG